ncbi:hypothetical protein [Desulfatitalea alkaliphila]|uniref:Uncharacterized protein n=1 Tax=Desulfatitalea alkaliphila TaxID=2929485 RepID=A0AA41UL56_9BACT|nr:hypothetical protein [Desulfatitalea alkaliphila]MCJ8501121.1 hypothetical protein [Desulfatitalea alkaliphila]
MPQHAVPLRYACRGWVVCNRWPENSRFAVLFSAVSAVRHAVGGCEIRTFLSILMRKSNALRVFSKAGRTRQNRMGGVGMVVAFGCRQVETISIFD